MSRQKGQGAAIARAYYIGHKEGYYSAFIVAKKIVEANDKEITIAHLENIIWELGENLRNEPKEVK